LSLISWLSYSFKNSSLDFKLLTCSLSYKWSFYNWSSVDDTTLCLRVGTVDFWRWSIYTFIFSFSTLADFNSSSRYFILSTKYPPAPVSSYIIFPSSSLAGRGFLAKIQSSSICLSKSLDFCMYIETCLLNSCLSFSKLFNFKISLSFSKLALQCSCAWR